MKTSQVTVLLTKFVLILFLIIRSLLSTILHMAKANVDHELQGSTSVDESEESSEECGAECAALTAMVEEYRVPEYEEGNVFRDFRLEIDRPLKAGLTRSVYLVQEKGHIDVKRVLKVTYRSDESKCLLFYNEAKVMAKLKHPYIVDLKWAVSFPAHHAIAMEYCKLGSITNLLTELHWPGLQRCFLHICKAVIHLHNLNIVHRDIKLDNIVVDGHLQAKLTDFEFAEILPPGETRVSPRCVGTRVYLAPELILNPLKSHDGFKLDAFAVGVVFWGMCLRRIPTDPRAIFGFNRNNIWPVEVANYGKAIDGLLEMDPESRCSLQDVRDFLK